MMIDKVYQSISDGVRFRLHHISHLTMRDNLGKSAYISHQHGTLEVIGHLCDTALGGMLIGLCHQIGQREIVANLLIGDEMCVPIDPVVYPFLTSQLDVVKKQKSLQKILRMIMQRQ